MATRWYPLLPANYAVGLGALADILMDDPEAPGTLIPSGEQGYATLVPEEAVTFGVYDAVGGTQITSPDLVDANGTPIAELTTPTEWPTNGQILRFGVVDRDDLAEVYVTSDPVNGPWYALQPASQEWLDRLTIVETALSALSTTDLADVSATAPEDGQVLVWDNGQGEYVPSAAPGTGTVTSVAEVEPTSGNIPTSALLSALGLTGAASDLATIKASVKVVLKEVSGGYPSKGIFTYGEYQGVSTPVTGVVDGDTWLQPASGT